MQSFKIQQILIFLITIFPCQTIIAQVAWFYPLNPSITDSVILTYNTNTGNKTLVNYDGPVYLHTGAITDRSRDRGDWKHIIGNWGEADERVKMKSIGNGMYEFRFVINSFYNLQPDEIVKQLAFVFRSEDGSKVGKTMNNEAIFLSVNKYKSPIPGEKKYLFESRKYVSHLARDSILDILTSNGLTRVIPFSENIIKILHFSRSISSPDSSNTVILKPQAPYFKIFNSDNWLRLITDSLSVAIHKDPYYLVFIYNGDTILEEEHGFFERSDTDGLRFKIEDEEKIYGLKKTPVGLNLVGSKYNLNTHPKYGNKVVTNNLNNTLSFIVSSNKYLLFFDNPQKGYVDIGATETGVLEWAAIGGLMKYFVVAGSDYKSISKNYAELTGTEPMHLSGF